MNISSNFRSKDALNSLHTLLNANNVESCKKLINDLSLLWAVQVDKVDFSKLAKDDFGTSLIPDIDCKQASHPVALKSTANGDCLYNSVSLFLCGDETRSNWLRLLVAEELYSNAEYYATHEIFKNSAKLTDTPESVLFTVALTAVGDKIISDGGSQTEAVKAEAIASCKIGVWGSLLHVMAFASVIKRPIYSLYPDINFRFRPLMHQLLNPRLSALDDGRDPVYLLWSRDGSFDNRPSAWYKPNHFVLVAWLPDATSHTQATPQVPVTNISDNVKTVEKKTSVGAKQGNILTFLKPAQAKPEKKGKGKAGHLRDQPEKTATKRSAENAELTLDDKEQVAPKKPASKRKFLQQWQGEFTWVVFDKDDNKMTCKICCAFPHLAGKTEFVSGCRTFKKETLQKHNVGGGHLHARDASLAKQKPMENMPIAQGFRRGGKVVEEQNRKELEVKVNTAYLIAKEELPFTKFHPILSLQKKNGLALNMTYTNDKGCNNFVSQISAVMTEQLATEVNSKKYISLLIDGATDASGKENETVHCHYVKDGQPLNRLVGHKAVAHGHAQGKF